MCLPAELKAFDVVILNDVIDKGTGVYTYILLSVVCL
jgi:hypothetical protein